MKQGGWLRFGTVTLPDAFADLARSPRWLLARLLILVLMATAAASGCLLGLVISYATGTPRATGAGTGAVIGLLVAGGYMLLVGARAMWVYFHERRTYVGNRVPLRTPIEEPRSNVRSDE